MNRKAGGDPPPAFRFSGNQRQLPHLRSPTSLDLQAGAGLAGPAVEDGEPDRSAQGDRLHDRVAFPASRPS